MREQLGADYEAFLQCHTAPSPVSIRVNPRKGYTPTNGMPIPWTASGFYLAERPSFTLDPAFHAGSYYVQEASSMFLEQAFRQSVDQAKPLHVLDLCAAPGGKSTHLISLLNKESLLVSNDVIKSRATVLAENVQKWGYNNVVVTNNDPGDFQRLPGFFDVIVVDAPCSGEGLFRKDPDARTEWTPDNVQLCSRRQRRILSDVWPALKQGGILIYSTCTYNESENEENLSWLKNEQDIEFITLQTDDSWGIKTIVEQDPLVTEAMAAHRFYPHRVSGEGLFISVIRKLGEAAETRTKWKHAFTGPTKAISEQLNRWVLQPEEKTFIVRNDKIQFFPKDHTPTVELLSKSLYILTAGTVLASAKHDKLVPEHPGALSVELNKDNFKVLDVDLSDALRFLRKETMTTLPSQKGFTLVQCNGQALGWVNVLDNRMNNLYPSEWRIRMSDQTRGI